MKLIGNSYGNGMAQVFVHLMSGDCCYCATAAAAAAAERQTSHGFDLADRRYFIVLGISV